MRSSEHDLQVPSGGHHMSLAGGRAGAGARGSSMSHVWRGVGGGVLMSHSNQQQ